MSAPFTESVLTKHQFAAILSNFFGENINDTERVEIIDRILAQYAESSDERIARLRQVKNIVYRCSILKMPFFNS